MIFCSIFKTACQKAKRSSSKLLLHTKQHQKKLRDVGMDLDRTGREGPSPSPSRDGDGEGDEEMATETDGTRMGLGWDGTACDQAACMQLGNQDEGRMKAGRRENEAGNEGGG